MTKTALEQSCDLRQSNRGATTEAQQSKFIDEIIDITVPAQRQKPQKSKRFQQTTKIPQSKDSEDRGDSTTFGFRKPKKIHQFQYTIKMVDDTAEGSEDSADAAGPVHRAAG